MTSHAQGKNKKYKKEFVDDILKTAKERPEFVFKNPKSFLSDLKDEVVVEIKKILANEVAPMLAMHGGAVEFVGFDAKSGVVSVRLKGMCKGCSLAELTLKGGIEAVLCAKVHGVTKVESVE